MLGILCLVTEEDPQACKNANTVGGIATEIGLDCMKESQKRKEQNQNKEIQDLCHHGNAEVIPNSSLESRNLCRETFSLLRSW